MHGTIYKNVTLKDTGRQYRNFLIDLIEIIHCIVFKLNVLLFLVSENIDCVFYLVKI